MLNKSVKKILNISSFCHVIGFRVGSKFALKLTGCAYAGRLLVLTLSTCIKCVMSKLLPRVSLCAATAMLKNITVFTLHI